MFRDLIFYITVLLYASSCGTSTSSLLFINKDFEEVKRFFETKNGDNNFSFKYNEKTDSLVVVCDWARNPFKAIFLFKENNCYYQEMNIYCSDCADEMVNDIIKEEKYRFVPIDPVNYVSKNNDNIVLRLQEKLDDLGNCNKITILKTSSSIKKGKIETVKNY